MKTHEEIKKGLECCAVCNDKSCQTCGYDGEGITCVSRLCFDALALIHRLDKDCVDAENRATAMYDRVEQLEAEVKKYEEGYDALIKIVKRLETERDAAVGELVGTCEVCRWEETGKCASCHFNVDAWNVHESNWEWRGVQKEG